MYYVQIMVTAGCLRDAKEAVELVKDHGIVPT